MSGPPGGTVTFLFTDIEGSTRLLRRLGDGYAEVLTRHDRVIRAACAENDGHEIDSQGDAYFLAFARAHDAVAAAAQVQRGLAAEAWPEGSDLRVRVGLHTGDAARTDGRYVGLSIHRAARICAAAHGGQVLLSSATREILADDIPAGMSFRDLGRSRLKDFDRPERLFQLVGPGLDRDFARVSAPHAPRVRPRTRAAVAAALVAIAATVAGIVLLTVGGSRRSAAVVVAADSVGVIDPGHDRLEAKFATGPSPSRVVAGADAVWVTNADGASVSRVDRVTHAVQQIPVGGTPAGIAISGGAAWVADTAHGTVAWIPTDANRVVHRTPVGIDPTGVAATAGAVWVANSGAHSIQRIDPATGTAGVPIDVGAAPTDLAAGAGALWVTSARARTLTRVDPRTGAVEGVTDVGGGASGVAVAAGSVWVANELDGTVSRVDPETGRVLGLIQVGNGPRSIAPAPGGVWVTEQFGGSVARIDARHDRVSERVDVGNRPTGLATVNGALWVGVRASDAAHRGGTLRVPATYDLDSVDPAVAYVPLSATILSTTNDGLTAYEKVGGSDGTQLVPDLAVSLPTAADDGRVYRFVIRRGIRYSTGRPVRPADVRASFERMFAIPSSKGHDFFGGIVGARACIRAPRACDLSRGISTGPGPTVTFRLTAPDPDFLDKLTLGFAAVLPAGTPARAAGTRPLPATGPYMIVRYLPGHELRLARNPQFREWSQAAQPDGFPDAVAFRFNVKGKTAVTDVERGRADDFAGAKDTIPADRVRER